MKVIIIGAGIAGLSAAIALKRSIPSLSIQVFELRAAPSTIGGAVNLTPNALRYLAWLGALARLQRSACPVRAIDIVSARSGLKVAALSFAVPRSDGHQALRAKRADLLAALTATWREELGGAVAYGARVTAIASGADGVRATVAVGAAAPLVVDADLLLGADGIHSGVRGAFVEPGRAEVYSGVATANGIARAPEAGARFGLPFEDTGVFASRRGSLLVSFASADRRDIFMGAVMETAEVPSREGWDALGRDQDAVRAEIYGRFCESGPLAKRFTEVLDLLPDWFVYPVYKLPPGGVWCKDRVLLLGDAAHAVSQLFMRYYFHMSANGVKMPPQGESTGFAIEDALLFSRIMKDAVEQAGDQTVDVSAVFARYERNRRKRINEAFAEADMRWETVKDKGWLVSVLLDWFTPIWLWWTKAARENNYRYDVTTAELLD